jgi:hypothetical protein
VRGPTVGTSMRTHFPLDEHAAPPVA